MTDHKELVQQLKKASGYDLLECKKALVSTNWDIDAATEYLRGMRVDYGILKERRR